MFYICKECHMIFNANHCKIGSHAITNNQCPMAYRHKNPHASLLLVSSELLGFIHPLMVKGYNIVRHTGVRRGYPINIEDPVYGLIYPILPSFLISFKTREEADELVVAMGEDHFLLRDWTKVHHDSFVGWATTDITSPYVLRGALNSSHHAEYFVDIQASGGDNDISKYIAEVSRDEDRPKLFKQGVLIYHQFFELLHEFSEALPRIC